MDGQGLWTLDQLTEQVEAALSVDYPGAPSGRVRSVPDRRAIRWYTTIGLVDRPASTRGRTALYAERHLLQLVAIKRLQAAGRSLADIQAELAGIPESTLRLLARLPDHPPGPDTPAAAPRSDRFWSASVPPASATLPPGGATRPDSPAASAVPATAAVAAGDALATAASDTQLTPPTDAARAEPPDLVTGHPAPASPGPARSGLPDFGPAHHGSARAEPPDLVAGHPVPGSSGAARSGLPDFGPAQHGAARAAVAQPATAAAGPLSPILGRPAAETAARETAPDRPVQAERAVPGHSAEVTGTIEVAPAIALPGGVTLLLPPGTPYPAAADLAAIRTATVPLLTELGRRGVIATDSTEGKP
jgi:hypothetical protein